MGNFLQTILKLIQSLFGGDPTPPTSDPTEPDPCLVVNIEIPPTQDLDQLPVFEPTTSAQSITEATAQGFTVSCDIQIRPDVGFVNVRGGPRLDFGVIALTIGGTTFKLQGASEKDPDGYRWYTITTPAGAGWVRGDMVIIGEDCLAHTFINEDDLTPPDPVMQTPTERFPLPTNDDLNLGYSTNHPAYDLDTDMGTPIPAASAGLIIRIGTCTKCEGRSRPNIYPCIGSSIINDPAWGYGYGNFVTVRHNYDMMPPTMRQHMDNNGLTDGFVYILYAHFSEVRVALGDIVNQGDVLGLSGNHGCSSAPHLHFEIRMGRDETVDGRWLSQSPVDPMMVFDV